MAEEFVQIAVTGGHVAVARGAGTAGGGGEFEGGARGGGGSFGQQRFAHGVEVFVERGGGRCFQFGQRIGRGESDLRRFFPGDAELSGLGGSGHHVGFFLRDVFRRQIDRDGRGAFGVLLGRGGFTVVEQARIDLDAVDFECARHDLVVIRVAESFHLVFVRPP